jgi:hypothetical protein
MSRIDGHLSDELLRAFVTGSVDEDVAVRLAEHIDGCLTCETRAATAEPLASAFASVPVPQPPAALIHAVLRDVDRPERGPVVEIAIGLALLLVAILLTGLGGNDAVQFAVDASRWAHGIERAGAAIGAPTYAAWLAGIGLIGVGAIVLGSLDRDSARWRTR